MLNETVETKQEGQRVAGLGILKHDGQNFSKNWILILPIEAVWEWRAALFLLHAAKGLLLGFTGGRHLGLRLVLHLFGDPGEQWRQEGWNDGTTTTQSRKAAKLRQSVHASRRQPASMLLWGLQRQHLEACPRLRSQPLQYVHQPSFSFGTFPCCVRVWKIVPGYFFALFKLLLPTQARWKHCACHCHTCMLTCLLTWSHPHS